MLRWLKVGLVVFFLLGIAVATLPWWIAVAARPVLAKQGITLVHAVARDFRTLHIDEAKLVSGGTTVVVRQLELPSPLFWLRSSGRRASAGTWSVNVQASPTPTPSGSPGITGMPALHTLLQKIARALEHWLPQATVGAGEVRWPRGGLTLGGATWKQSVLTGRDLAYLGQTVDLTIDASAPAQLAVEARAPQNDATAKLVWRDAQVTGVATLWGQPINLDATFPAVGWWPDVGSARAENWSVPAERAHLAAHYGPLTGHGEVAWREGKFTASVHADALPRPGIKAPPLKAHLEAGGDLEGVTIRTLEVDAPFAQASLSEAITVAWRGKTIAETPAQLRVEADLSKQSWIDARGRLTGSVRVIAGGRQEFSLTLEDASLAGFVLQRALARGHWDGRLLELDPLEVWLDESTHARVTGGLNWENRQLIGVKFEATANPAAFARWLPAGTTWNQASVKGTAGGSLTAPQHAGQLRMTAAHAGPLKPFDLAATWQGAGQVIDNFSADLAAAKSGLHAAGRADQAGLSLRELVFTPAGVEQLSLAAPARIEWSPAWRADGVRLQGPVATLALNVGVGAARSFELSAAHLDKEWIHDWLDLRGPTWRVEQVDLAGRMTGDVLDFRGSLRGEIHLPGREVSRVVLAATGDRAGIKLTELKISEGGALLTDASGRVAARWTLDANQPLLIDRDAPLELQARVLPDSPLWAALGEPAGIKLAGAAAGAAVKGTLAHPEGEFHLNITSLQVAPGSRWRDRVPDVAGLALAASGDRAEIRLDSFVAKIEGQEVRARGRVPMAGDRWRQLLDEPAKFNWRAIEARVEVPAGDLAVLARRFPQLPAARGLLHAEVELAPGGKLSGSLSLRDGATRPLPALGVIQEITAEIRFSDRTARVESFAGRLGGEPVQLQGSVELPPGEEPRPDLHLTGKNLPLVRQAGLLVRTDLDLHAVTKGRRTQITGVVNLRDCLVLTDFSDLFPTGVRGARRQPPYFSVSAEPFADWGLAVEIRGASAVRMRTPFFTGNASAHFTLGGNLGEPRAIGEITVEEGRVFFPFATFTVENGAVRLKAADPFTPEIALNAISRRHNYELRLEVSGAPESPVLVFSSNPALEAGQVLLMVMAGQIPANETNGTPGQGGLQLTQLGAYLGQGIYRGLGGTDENRLEIVSGERVSRQGRETYDIEYKLGEHWSLVGEYDEFDSYNAGVKWRVYTQEARREKK